MGAGVVEKVESWREADGVRVDKIMTRPDYSRLCTVLAKNSAT
jgi:hypothetical protein